MMGEGGSGVRRGFVGNNLISMDKDKLIILEGIWLEEYTQIFFFYPHADKTWKHQMLGILW